jgi:hypothetical protein
VEALQASGVNPIPVGKARIHALLYADDVSMLASNAVHLQELMDHLKIYFEKNGMKVNLGKTKVVIFRRGKRLATDPVFTWGDEQVEIVDKYIYLGVPFYSDMNKFDERVCSDFIAKAKLAENSLIQLFNRSRLTTLRNRILLFNSMVRSVLLYCSSTWALSVIDKLEMYQINFFRRILGLPKYTPHWLIRLETGTTQIRSFVLKLALGFIDRIMTKDPDSLVRQCYEGLRVLHEKKNMKNNWYGCLDSFLIQSSGVEKLQDNIVMQGDGRRLAFDVVPTMISECFKLDVVKLQESNSYCHFRNLNITEQRQEYLDYDLPWDFTRLYCQLRVGTSFFRFKNFKYFLNGSKFKKELCILCGRDIEDDFHVMCICPHYNNFRKILFSNSPIMPSDRLSFRTFFKSLSLTNIKQIYYFWASVNRLRNFFYEISS